jgi:enamine deaminase RidA (YjgF/YER057c/UK114 family)
MKTAITHIAVSSDELIASRRSFVAGAVALGVTVTSEAGDAQTPQNLHFQNPSGLSAPRGYSHVVEVTAPGRMVYIAGQTGVDAGGRVLEGFRAQATQEVFENLKIALASAGAGFEHVVKLNSYLTAFRPSFRSCARCAKTTSTGRPRQRALQLRSLNLPIPAT